MKLPRYTATTPPPRETGLVRAQDIGALTRTGGQEFEAIAGAGRAIQQTASLAFEAYQNRQALDDQATMGEISKRATDADTEAINTIAGFDPSVGDALPNDPKNYYDGTKLNRFDNPQKEAFINTTYKDYEAKILSLAKGIKNPKTRQMWINSQLPDAYQRITDAANLKHQQYQEQLILGNARAAAAAGDMETANQWVEIAEKYGLIGPKKAAVERENNIKEYITGLYRTGSKAYEAGNVTGAEALYTEAKKVLEASSLSETQKEDLEDEIDTDKNRAKTQTQLAVEQKDDEIGKDFLDLLTNKLEPAKEQLTFDMINASELSFDAKDKWFTKLRTFDNYSEGELKEAFTDKGEVLADIYNRIDRGTVADVDAVLKEGQIRTITDDQIREQVGKGLSAPTAQRIITQRRRPFEKDTEQLFKRIFGWSPELGWGTKIGGLLYEKVLREWQAEVKEQDATGEKIIEIGRSIARPYFLEYLQAEMAGGEDISRMMELALGEETEKLETPKPIEAEVPREEPGEPLAYADFRREVSRLKGIDGTKAQEYYNLWIGKFRKE